MLQAGTKDLNNYWVEGLRDYALSHGYGNYGKYDFDTVKSYIDQGILGGGSGGYNWYKDIENKYNSEKSAAQQAGKEIVSRSQYNDIVNAQNKLISMYSARSNAAKQAAQTGQSSANQAVQSGINAGLNLSRAGMLGDAAAISNEATSGVGNSTYASQRGQQAATQADYLARIGEIEGLENSASNMENAADAAAWSAGISGAMDGATSGAFLTSDERVKEYDNHSNLPKADVDDALRRIESIEFKYKDDTGLDKEDHVGVTAQSVEGTAFDDMVSENPEGYKQLDKQMMLEAVLAGIASLRKELDTLEGR